MSKLNLSEDLFDDVTFNSIEVAPPVTAPIEVQDETLPGPDTGIDTGVSNLLMNLIKDEYEAIQGYNDFIANLNGHEEMKPIIEDIVAEENTHIGQLQELLKTISPNVSEIDTGTAEAQEQLNAKDYPLDESAKSKVELSNNKLKKIQAVTKDNWNGKFVRTDPSDDYYINKYKDDISNWQKRKFGFTWDV